MNSMVVVYKYKPLIGIIQVKDLRDFTTYYDYDATGKLKEIFYYEYNDINTKRILEEYLYNSR